MRKRAEEEKRWYSPVFKIIILFCTILLTCILITAADFYKVLPMQIQPHPKKYSDFEQHSNMVELVEYFKNDKNIELTTALSSKKHDVTQQQHVKNTAGQRQLSGVRVHEINTNLNITETINAVIREEKSLILEEMKNYTYPKILRGRKISNLSDLVLSNGGDPIRNVVVATWRSGSSFMGDLLNHHPGTFFQYEPLFQFGRIRIKNGQMADDAVALLKDLMMCNYTHLDDYIEIAKNHTWFVRRNTTLWTQCDKHPEICWEPQFLNPFCKLFPFKGIKTVRIRLKFYKELLDDPRLNIHLLYLVRDPRGIMQSRNHLDWCIADPDCGDPYRLCNDLVSNYHAAKEMKEKHKDRIKIIRYEDMVLNIYQESRKIVEFFNLEFSQEIKHFLDTHTHINKGSIFSTSRDSKDNAFKWTTLLEWKEVEIIQSACDDAMDLWGYNTVNNEDDLNTFNPMRKLHFDD